MTRASLRSRLGLLIALALGVITAIATTAVLFQQSQEEQASLVDAVELAAFQLSETQTPNAPSMTLDQGVERLALVFDAESNVLGATSPLDPELEQLIIDEVWTYTTEQDTVSTLEIEDDGRRRVLSGVVCVDQGLCDTVVVSAAEEPFSSFLWRGIGWLLVPTLLATLLGWFATRWLVGRSLRPVEAMRQELDQITDRDLQRLVPVPQTGDELQRLGTSMNQTLNRLGSAVTANERFVADAAHELRSPITGVKAALELQLTRSSSGLLDDSVSELDRASRLVDDLLLLARREGATRKLVEVDLDDLVRSAIGALRTKRPDIEITHSLEPFRLRADHDGLHRVITNVLENAASYGNGRIAATLRKNSGQVVLQIDDDGPGISPEHRAIVFDRFTRLDESRSRATGGSGLGLAIVKEIANEHGATLTISDSDLGGACFALRFPSAPVPLESR